MAAAMPVMISRFLAFSTSPLDAICSYAPSRLETLETKS